MAEQGHVLEPRLPVRGVLETSGLRGAEREPASASRRTSGGSGFPPSSFKAEPSYGAKFIH